MEKEIKTNAMRKLEKEKVTYKVHYYECDGFLEGTQVAEILHQDTDHVFKTLVTQGKSKNYFVFVIPVDQELDLKKAAKVVGEKSIEMIPVKDINSVTGYVRGGCSPIGMKKQYETVFHNSAQDLETIIFSGGKIGTQIEMNTQNALSISRGILGDIVKS